jgi:hypothetical protein
MVKRFISSNLNTALIYHNTAVIYCGILIRENVGTAVNVFIALAPYGQ